MDFQTLSLLNPWWEDRNAIGADIHLKAILHKSYFFDNPIKGELTFQHGRTYILRGARQIGKTTLLKEKIKEAIFVKRYSNKCCCYVSCEGFENFSQMQEVLAHWLNQHKNKKILLCLDEVTFVDQWQRAFLWLINAGLLATTTTLITGSNSRDLQEMGERFPGRDVHETHLFPLSFQDYITLKCFKNVPKHELLLRYLETGGFPHAIRDYVEFGFVTDDTYATYTNWILGDAHRFKLRRDILNHILYRLFETLGSRVTWPKIIEDSPVKSHETALSYVNHLDLSFLCHVLHCYDPNKHIVAPRKSKKIYFIDPLLYALSGGYLQGVRNIFDWWKIHLKRPAFWGKIFESIVISETIRQYSQNTFYWYSSNTGREVDILLREGATFKLFDVKTQEARITKALNAPVDIITPTIFINPSNFLNGT